LISQVDGFPVTHSTHPQFLFGWPRRYGRAAAAGDAHAQLELANLLARGSGGPRDVPGAYALWAAAAAAGLATAARNLERADRCFVGVKFEQ
jgi:hypothetical protein